MYQKLLHTRGLRLLGGLLGSLLLAAAINVFIVPQGLYGGGAYGLCQVIRTLVLRALDLYGAIIGRACYIGAIDLKEALEAAK